MPDEGTDAAAQAAAAATAQAADQKQKEDAAAQAAEDAAAQAATTEPTLEELKADIERRDKRQKAAEKRVADLEARLKTDEDAKLTELDKAKKDAADATAAREKAEADLLSERLDTAIVRAAILAGFSDPGDAVAFADRTDLLVDAKVDEAAVKAAVEAVLKAKPYLKGQAAPLAGSTTSATNGAASKTGSITPEALAKMSPEDIAPLLSNEETKAQVYAALATKP